MIKLSLKQHKYQDILTQPVALDIDHFVFVANFANGDHLRLHCGIYRKTFEYQIYFQSVIMLVPSVVKMKQQPVPLKQPSSIKSTVEPFRK